MHSSQDISRSLLFSSNPVLLPISDHRAIATCAHDKRNCDGLGRTWRLRCHFHQLDSILPTASSPIPIPEVLESFEVGPSSMAGCREPGVEDIRLGGDEHNGRELGQDGGRAEGALARRRERVFSS